MPRWPRNPVSVSCQTSPRSPAKRARSCRWPSPRAALAAGAAGFLLKDTPPREVVRAVRDLTVGTTALSPAVKQELITSYVDRRAASRRRSARQRISGLSARELDVLRLLGTGESNAHLARRLCVSESTVKTCVSRLLTKLELPNRTQAALLAHEAGLLED